MMYLLKLFGNWQGFRERMRRLPGWGRLAIGLAALPGVILALLSLAALLVSILILFLPARLVYRLVCAVAGPGFQGRGVELAESLVPGGLGEMPPADFVEAERDGLGGASVRVEAGMFTDDPFPERARPARRQIDVKIIEPDAP
jgi:hypothetical protein